MGVQRHTVPHFKGLIELYLDLQAQGRDSTFTICHALVKRAILHYIKARWCNLEKKSTELEKKLTTGSLGPPKPISKEVLSPTSNTKLLAYFEKLHTLLIFKVKMYWKRR